LVIALLTSIDKNKVKKFLIPNPPHPALKGLGFPSLSKAVEQTLWMCSKNGASSPVFLYKTFEVKIWNKTSCP